MKSLIRYLTITTVMLVAGTAFADDPTYHARVRLQGLTAKENGTLGVSGVVEMPDVPVTPGLTLGLVGLGVKEEKFDLGIHTGTLMSIDGAEVVLDLRSSFNPITKLVGFANARWNDLGNADVSSLYSFAMLDYVVLTKAKLAVGGETENIVFASNVNKNDYSVGPNLLVGFTKEVRLELAYQVHSNDAVDNQFWTRLNIKL